jgi:hypothetical protein
MESGITTGLLPPPRADVLAEARYTHCEEDFVAWWMYNWEQAQNQRFHPRAHHLGSWIGLTVLRALAVAFVLVIAFAITKERCTNYILGSTAGTICWVLAVGLMGWFLRGPKGFLHKLARSRYRRNMRRIARQMAARKTEININRFHRLLLTRNGCIHLMELQVIEPGRRMTERTEIVTSWTTFERIEETEHHAFLIEQYDFVAILPCGAFPDKAAFRQFVNLARRLHFDAVDSKVSRADGERIDERIMR